MIPAGYDDPAEMECSVRSWARDHAGEVFDIAMLGMFCQAIFRPHRALYEEK